MRNYNTRIESVPTNFIASSFNFEKATYFEVNDAEVRRAPDVSFGEISYRGDAPEPQRQAGPASVEASNPNELPNPQAYREQPGIDFGQQAQPQQQPAEPPQSQDGPYEPPSYGRQ